MNSATATAQPRAPIGPERAGPAVHLVDATLDYDGRRVWEHLSLDIEPNTFITILGPNGSGKTSLLRVILGLTSLAAGSVEVLGQPPRRGNPGIGYVPQGRQIFGTLTVKENIETGLIVRGKSHVPSDIYDLFPVLADFGSRRGGNLSGGQQQQLAIARALASDPKVLLLDEPTEGIQPSIIKDIGRAISYLRGLGEMAIVLVEQYLDFASELGDHFAVMERGSIVYSCDKSSMDEGALKRALAI